MPDIDIDLTSADVEIDVTFPDPVITDVVVDRIGPSGGSLWGTIGGSLTNQSDLESSLNGKFTNSMSTGKLLGRTTASIGTVEEISIGNGLTLSNGLLISPGSNLNFTPARVYNVADYGAVGDGTTDDTTAIQDAINAAHVGSTVWFDPSKSYKITSTLTITNKYMLTLTSGSTSMNGSPNLIWSGAAHGTLLGIYDSYFDRVSGLGFSCANGTSVDYFIDTDRVSGFNSNHFFSYLFLDGSTGGNRGNTSFRAISIDKSGGANNENMQLENIRIYGSFVGGTPSVIANDGAMTIGGSTLTSSATFPTDIAGKTVRVGKAGAAGATLVTTCLVRTNANTLELADTSAATVTDARVHGYNGGGTGIHLGSNSNVKHIVLRNIQITGCNIGVNSLGGSVEIYNYGGGGCNVGAYINGTAEPVIIEQMVTEGNLIEVQGTGNPSPIILRACRGSNGTQLTESFYLLGGRVTWDNSQIEERPPVGGRIMQSDNTGTLELHVNQVNFVAGGNSPLTVSDSGLDTVDHLFTMGTTGISGWPNTFVIGRLQGGPGTDPVLGQVANNSKHVFSFAQKYYYSSSDNPASIPTSKDTRVYGDDEIEIFGVSRPNTPSIKKIGTHEDSSVYYFMVVAVDGVGNKSLGSFNGRVGNVNNTLSGSNYLHVEWPLVPNAASYEIYHSNPAAPESQGELLANGVTNPYYDVTSNPAGSYSTYSSLLPGFNQTTGIKYRARQINVIEPTLTANSTTPSVATSSDFVTANTNPTSITTFTDGIDGQTIRIRVNDTNTTFVNGTPLVTNSGGNITATNGLIYSFILRASKWRQI